MPRRISRWERSNRSEGSVRWKDLAAKIRWGIRGCLERGKSGGGRCCGHDVVKTTDSAGEPVRGERRQEEQNRHFQ